MGLYVVQTGIALNGNLALNRFQGPGISTLESSTLFASISLSSQPISTFMQFSYASASLALFSCFPFSQGNSCGTNCKNCHRFY